MPHGLYRNFGVEAFYMAQDLEKRVSKLEELPEQLTNSQEVKQESIWHCSTCRKEIAPGEYVLRGHDGRFYCRRKCQSTSYSQKTPEVQTTESLSAVDKALEELKEEMNSYDLEKCHYSLTLVCRKAQALVNALETEKNPVTSCDKIENVCNGADGLKAVTGCDIDHSEDKLDKVESKQESIWKPVSELPKDLWQEGFVKTLEGYFPVIFCGGQIYTHKGSVVELAKVEAFATYTDFITQFEQDRKEFRERLEKLEGKR